MSERVGQMTDGRMTHSGRRIQGYGREVDCGRQRVGLWFINEIRVPKNRLVL
jgi:hypothetical protein